MDILETQLGSLGFNLHSIPEVAAASLWTWLAVVAAAVGLWSIKAVGSKPDGLSSLSRTLSMSLPTSTRISVRNLAQVELHEPTACASVSVSAHSIESLTGHVEQVSSPKDRITMYYGSSFFEDYEYKDDYNDDENDDNNDDDETTMMSIDESDYDDILWRMELMKRDLGWYRYQDMTMLNGNVVKLWHGRKECRQSSMLQSIIF